ncbi:MAG: GDP-fucose synthetase [Chlamydiae bacterium RIFCSPHIGHO2_12_FULL_27_8]|nr:MAG: GDP-fucose synthetase [Chlamydiae bacterium RIFCSPHIGHO2_12_FULL_27_8]OGN65446.1 MAG: GDP-fucose synthetase [Chlamydiae bacterium RIFCSPLOWO2_01_FULL_28_7]
MKILITGANGFLGKFLSQKLLEEKHEIYKTSSKKNDLTLENSLDEFNNVKFDQIFHLAAWTQAGDFCIYHPGEQWIKNQKINTNILNWWLEKQPQAKMIAMGTSCSYDPDLPHIEENYLKGKPIDSLFTYAMTKRMLLTGLTALNKQYNLNYMYFIPSTLYGPEYHLDGRQMHFIFDLIRKILKGKYFDEKVILWGDGYQRRELVYVDDFINVMLNLIKTQNNTIINIGAGKDFSIREFAQKITENVGYNFDEIKFDTSKYVGAKSKILINDKLNKLLPKYNLLSLEQGLFQTIEWFEKNREKLIFPTNSDN